MDTRLKTLAIALIALAMVTAAFSTADARDAGGGDSGPYAGTISYDTGDISSGTLSFSDGILSMNTLQMTSDDSPAMSILTGTVKLEFSGTNTVTGAPGYAGIFVEYGATLVIEGEDGATLNAYGGNVSLGVTGAGIGGNGAEERDTFADFGTIIINSGTVNGYGGSATDSSLSSSVYGAAGIGSGSSDYDSSFLDELEENGLTITVGGSIIINNGTVSGHGGHGYWNGGAGIGTGSTPNSLMSSLSIEINGGIVTGCGGKEGDAAGIGGGAGSTVGSIEINGGEVYGYGSSSGYPFGGAGIGGSDPGSTMITVNGGVVYAQSDNGIAIGSGHTALVLSYYSEITVTGGTITVGSGKYPQDVTHSLEISGGSLNAFKVTSPTIDGETPAYKVTIRFEGVSENTHIDSIGIDGYGMNDVYTDSTGAIYVWLEGGSTLSTAIIGDKMYVCTPTVIEGATEVTFTEAVEYDYTVMSVDGGSVAPSSGTAYAGTTVTLTVTPDGGFYFYSFTSTPELVFTETDTGYTFTMPDSDVTITPAFIESTHTVTFYNGDSVHHTASVSHGEYLAFPEDPVKESDETTDYTFVEWRDSDNNPVSEQTQVLDDMELHAFYAQSERLYHIRFVAEGAVVWEGDLRYGDEITAPSAPSKEGYEFVGWQRYTPGMTVTADMTFGAIYQSIPEPDIPDWGSDDDDWVPPYISPQDDGDDDDLWLFVVLGSVALCLFLIFARYERRE